MPAALPQDRRRQQFVSVLAAGHGACQGRACCHLGTCAMPPRANLQGEEKSLLSPLAGAYCLCRDGMRGTGTCAVKEPKCFVKQNLLKPDPADPHADHSAGLPTLPTGPTQRLGRQMVVQTCLGALPQLPLAHAGWLCRNSPHVPLT